MSSGLNLALAPTPGSDSPALVEPQDSHNRTLVNNVHPTDWVNPHPEGRYNLVVIGAGTAGLVAAAGAAGLGGKVALIERHLMGGDCLNYGCVPSKGLLAAGHRAHEIRAAGDFGVVIKGEVEVDFAAAAQRMRRLRADISHHDSAARFRDLGVDVFLGEGRFTGPDSIEVDGQKLTFSRAVIATGARAVALPIPGAEGAGIYTNETIYNLTALPKRLVVIGAGPIGCELAQAFARFGSKVTIVHRDVHILPREDEAAAELLGQQLESEGIRIVQQASVEKIVAENDARAVVVEQHGQKENLAADAVLVAAGRKANVESLNLGAARVACNERGVKVNDRLQTSNKRIYAAGDVCSPYQFTHAADAMARIVIQNALFFGRKKQSRLVIPWATYTDPEIAHVGMHRNEALARGHDIAAVKVPFADIDRALLDGQSSGFAEVLYDKRQKGKILGATIVARHAGEMIGQLSMAMTAGLTLGSFSQTIFPYPTQSEVLKRLGDVYNRTRLSTRLKRFFTWFLKLRR